MNFNKKPKQKKSSFSFVKSYEGSSDKLPKPFFYAIIGIIYVLFILLYYYFILPALNFNSIPSWIFVFFIILPPLFVITHALTRKNILKFKVKKYNAYKIICGCFSLIYISTLVLCLIFGTRLFRAKAYSNLLKVDFETKETFNETFNYEDVKLPSIDKDIAYRLAQTKLGNYGDQYQISEKNFSIQSVTRNGESTLVRVVPLEFRNIFISLGNMNKGAPGYIEVNCVTQEAKFVPVEGGIKYLSSAMFSKDLNRYLRFNNINALYSSKYFKIDDEGNPYWVVPCHRNKVGLFNGRDPVSVILLNAVTGEIKNYKLGEEPQWVDHAISLDVMMNQANDYLKYKKGFINATFGAKSNVFNLSDGYNYLIKNNDFYFISTVTSDNENDQTSIGFLIMSLKTKETLFFNSMEFQGLTEMRARQIAEQEDSVKAQKFTSTWPILISIKGIPTYFLTLKNSVTVQKYCFIDVKTGGKISIADTLDKALNEYLRINQQEPENFYTAEDTIFRFNIIDEYVYFSLTSEPQKIYKSDLSLNPLLKLLNVGDKVNFKYSTIDNENIVLSIDVTFQ